MAIKLLNTVRNSMAQAIVDALNTGGAGSVKIYSGTRPAGVQSVATGSILSEHMLTDPSGIVNNGVIVFNAISEDAFANATGIATWARFFNGAGTAVFDCSVSVAGDGGDLQMNTVNIIINSPVRFTSLQITMPGG